MVFLKNQILQTQQKEELVYRFQVRGCSWLWTPEANTFLTAGKAIWYSGEITSKAPPGLPRNPQQAYLSMQSQNQANSSGNLTDLLEMDLFDRNSVNILM